MLNLLKYQTPERYASAFEDVYSYVNLKQVKLLSAVLLTIAIIVRLIGTVYIDELKQTAHYREYSISNLSQIIGSLIFLLLSDRALKSGAGKKLERNLLTFIFALYILSFTFNISYIYSSHNTKNTLMMFLIGIFVVSVFFALELKYIILLSLYVVVLFIAGIIKPALNVEQKIFNVVAAIVLASVLYCLSRYNYFVKSQQFVQIRLLEEKNLEIENLNHQKGEILGFVAHDLRNPLNNIEALSRLMLEEEEHRESPEVKLILTSAKQAKYIINDLIEVIQEENTPLQVQKTNMAAYLSTLTEAWQANVDKPRIITFKSDDTELVAAINPPKMTRVIDNLVGNGLKFSNPDTPINIEALKMNNHCIIRIKDHGIGIPFHLQEMLFDQFSKAGRPGLKGEKSIGLGLHISKDIVEQHGGHLSVESKENQGTEFIISLPILPELNSN